MRRFTLVPILILSLVPVATHAQETRSPYAGLEGRAIKALSPQEINALLAGEGMSLALPAELNGYPGPKHVLELSDSLGLSAEQQASVRAVFDQMAERAMQLGTEIVRLERVLDEAFAERRANKDSLVAVTSRIASLAGELRATHLAAHLELDGLLTEHQVMVYQRVRGYEHGGHGH